jgi:hypothetical protein
MKLLAGSVRVCREFTLELTAKSAKNNPQITQTTERNKELVKACDNRFVSILSAFLRLRESV